MASSKFIYSSPVRGLEARDKFSHHIPETGSRSSEWLALFSCFIQANASVLGWLFAGALSEEGALAEKLPKDRFDLF